MTPREIGARLLNLLKIGRVLLVDDSGPAQKMQVKLPNVGADGSPLAEYYRLGEFGHASRPPIGSEVVVGSLWGNRSHGLVIATNHQASRPTGLGDGDSMLYSAHSQRIWQTQGQTVVDCGGAALVFKNFSTCTIQGQLNVQGDVIANTATAPVSLATHQHFLQGPGVPETGAPIPANDA